MAKDKYLMVRATDKWLHEVSNAAAERGLASAALARLLIDEYLARQQQTGTGVRCPKCGEKVKVVLS